MDRYSLFKELTEAFGPSGFEEEPRRIMKRYFTEHGYSVFYDRLGSIIGAKEKDSPRILVCAHMDEIGFMVKNITKIGNKGYIRFLPVGGWWEGVLLGQKVRIKTKDKEFIGIIGAKPPHEMKPEERKKTVELKHMFIDIGITKDKGAEELGIKPGDPIVPYAEFKPLENKTLSAKAWDDRMGCSAIIEASWRLKDTPNSVFFSGTVQEEVGLRGARTVANLIKPDIAFAIDVSIARDIPGEEAEQVEYLGNGIGVLIHDSTMIPNLKLRDWVIELFEKEGIKYHLTSIRGGYDTGVIHLSNIGVPSLALGIPTRYIHSHVSLIHEDDYENLVNAIVIILEKLDKETVSKILSFE